jgi:hypothetical protein
MVRQNVFDEIEIPQDLEDSADALPAGLKGTGVLLDMEYQERKGTQAPEEVHEYDEDVDEDVVYSTLHVGGRFPESQAPGFIGPDPSVALPKNRTSYSIFLGSKLVSVLSTHTNCMPRFNNVTLFQLPGTLRGLDGKPISVIKNRRSSFKP